MTYAREYAEAILRRGRVPMEPLSFSPDWTDRPRKWKHYAGVDCLPLPHAAPTAPAPGTVHQAIFGDAADAGFTAGTLGEMLRDCYGLLGRRLAVNANTDLAALPAYTHANWHRGTASGGGLYPVTIYWVAGRGGPVLPGVHHYAPHQHALRPLLLGDVAGEVRAAIGGGEEEHFLVLGVKYWQNAFKYNSFCFHAVSMDAGAVTQAMRTWARSAGLDATPRVFFDERRLAHLLGVDDSEGIFAVVPLRWAGDRPARKARVAGPSPRVRHADVERSRTVVEFDAVRQMQATTRQDVPGEPVADALRATALAQPGGEVVVPLPQPRRLDHPLRTTIRRRRSSFGRFDARTPVHSADLSTALAAVDRAAQDAAGADLVGVYVYVNHVSGGRGDPLPPGVYRYEAPARLHLLDPTPPGEFLQANYFLENYNLERAGVVVVPTMRIEAVLDAVGERGYRLVNATIGAVAQNFYLAGAAMDLGAGVALGFDNLSYVEHLRLTDGERPLLVMMLGTDRPGTADFRYEIA